MELYISQTHSDEDGAIALKGKLGIIEASKEDILKLCDFFSDVKKHMNKSETCHMHFRDSFPEWNKNEYIDLEINIKD